MKISLRACRVNAGYTIKEVSEIMHISKPTIIAYETGKRKPKRAMLMAFASLYNAPINDIILPDNLTVG